MLCEFESHLRYKMNQKSEHVNSWITFIEESSSANPWIAKSTILSTIQSLIDSDAGDIVDDILQHVDPTKLPIIVSLAFLSSTKPYGSLPSRKRLRSSIEQHLRSKNENADELLAGL